MQRFALICLLLAGVLAGSLAANYEGRVLDADGQPVIYATVYLQDDPITGTATGSDGRFLLTTDAPASSAVVISYIGYQKKVLTLSALAALTTDIMLVEQPIALQETVVSAQASKQKNKRKDMARLLYLVYNRMQYDFPDQPYKLRIVSDVKMNLENAPWGMEQMVATVVQIPEKGHKGNDSVQFKGEYCKRFFKQTIRNRADTILAGNNLDRRVRKMAVEMDSGVVVHRSLWAIGNIRYDFEQEMNDLKNWSVSRENEGETVLTYREHKNYLGIFKYEILRHYIVDSQTYRVRRFAEEGTVDANIPFGHKLKSSELELLNLLNMDATAIEKFRLKSGHAKTTLNTLYRMQDGKLYPVERNMQTSATLQSTRSQNQTIPIKVKATQHVTGLQTKGVQPFSHTPSRRVKREIVPVY